MLVLGLIAGICIWVSIVMKDRDFHKRREFAKQIVSRIDYQQVFDDHYMGRFDFDSGPKQTDRELAVIEQYDRGVESRLFIGMAQKIPKWVLSSVAEQLNASISAQVKPSSSGNNYVDGFLHDFAQRRAEKIESLLNAPVKPEQDGRQRRKRRR